jgi:signal transduction histidine kinase
MPMKWWSRLGLLSRIVIILILLLCTALGMGVTTIWYAGLFNKMLNQVIVEDIESLHAARELETALANQKGFVTYYFLDGDEKWLKELETHRIAFKKWLNTAQEHTQFDEDARLLKEIRDKYEVYISQKNKVIELYKHGDRKNGEKLHWDVRKEYFELNELCRQYTHVIGRHIEETKQISRARMRNVSLAAVVLMTATFILGLLLGFVMITQIIIPIRKLSYKTKSSQETSINGDEIYQLSHRVHGLMEDMDRTQSELHQSQALLMNSEKLALIGKLSTEVAHSIRNPMTSINMRLFSLKRSLKLSDYQNEDFEVVSEEMHRLDNIVRNFLEFSRPPKLKKQKINISHVIDTTLALLSYRIELHSVNVVRKTGHHLPLIEADPEILKEVFVNLIVNACEAMESGGKIEIFEEEALAENIGRAVLVKVSDNGPGMSEELQAKVMEPFETTKPDGTGLGLFTSLRIVEEHGGKMDMNSKEGEGTTFIITFPVPEEVSA